MVEGAGRAFSAGFDLKESAAEPIKGVAAWREVLKRDLDMTMRFWRLAKPTIAAVHGYCLAGACELAVACDITIAADDAVFGEPELRFGSGIVTLILPWVVGPKRAKEILLTGNDRLSAREAHAMGLVNRVVPRADLEAEALRTARTIAVMDGGAVRLTKEAINRAADIMGLPQALEAGIDLAVQVEMLDTPERREFDAIRRRDGLKAALAWRDARFAGPGSAGRSEGTG